MNLKKYNEQTQTWDIIASGNASGIVVTDPHFVDDGGLQKSVNDVLVEMNEKIELTRRNLSWVVQNGTLGGGGGSGSVTAGIGITNSDIKIIEGVNYLYATSPQVTLNYLITDIIPNAKYYINVALDGTNIIKDLIAYSSISGKIIIDNIAMISSSSSHSVVITVTNENGIDLVPYILNVVEATINVASTVSSASATIGNPYYIEYTVTNKMLGSETTLIVTNETNGFVYSTSLGTFTSGNAISKFVNFFDLFNLASDASTGATYTISAKAVTVVNDLSVESGIVYNQVVVEDGKTLVVLVSGITQEGAEEVTKFELSGNISFTFTPYLADIQIVYYALRIQRGSIIHDIGNFDADLTNFDLNPYVHRATSKVFNWAIPAEEAYLGDYKVYLKCWSEKGTPDTTLTLVCEVIQADQSLMLSQYPSNELYAQWHIKQNSFSQLLSTSPKWVSTVTDWNNPKPEIGITTVNTDLNVYDTNGVLSGFLTTEEGQGKLRLSGEAYGVINVQPFAADPTSSTTSIENWGARTAGFTFSVTFKSDQHPSNDGTIFFIGDYDTEGELSEGIWVGLEDIIWKYRDNNIVSTVSTKIQQNTVTTIDFVVINSVSEGDNTGELKIFVNGVLRAARQLSSFRWQTNSKIYLGCKYNNGEVSNFADVEFYEMSLYTNALNDFQIVVNSMNSRSRATLLEGGIIDFNQYNIWKTNNFFKTTTSGASTLLWDNTSNQYANIDFNTLVASQVHLPVLHINCLNTSPSFTKAAYEAVGSGINIGPYNGCTLEYYDPATNQTVSTTEVSVSLQGTSSMGYRSKNLEIAFNKDIGGGKKELFRPKSSWFPENQFTLKADVVDSAHANNAAIGKWINDNADTLFDKTPPMVELENNRPYNCGSENHYGNKFNNVTIKHTLEGFPIILLVTFAGESTQEMLGIYSFNLGRAAYYNMGMKFLKCFTHDIFNADNTTTEINELPAFVTKYEEYGVDESFGSIKQSEIYSYEFGENSNITGSGDDIKPIALFMQDHLSILQHVGSFRFNGANSDKNPTQDVTPTVWTRLQSLFSTLSQMVGGTTKKYQWNASNSSYEETGEFYSPGDWSTLSAQLNNRISLKNAYSYFMVCVIFGLVDSLGKNMTLRSWNVNNDPLVTTSFPKWYPCFYDMDTANGLSNIGEEDVPKTAYIDGFSNRTNTDGVNSLVITPNDPTGGYDTYSSRLWDVLRDNRFLANSATPDITYESLWTKFRDDSNIIGAIGNDLSGATTFVNSYFGAQTSGCGELLYNYDFRVKYLTKYIPEGSSTPSYGNVLFLHGTRIDYVRDWLSKRFTFMDGVFNYTGVHKYPYITSGAFSCGGPEDGNATLLVKINNPAIMIVNIGNTNTIRYFVDENVQTPLILSDQLTSFNTQVTINNTSEICEIGGLKDLRFQRFMDTLTLPKLSDLNLSNVNTLASSGAIDFKYDFGELNPEMRHIDLSNTAFLESSTSNDFKVDIAHYEKLKTLDISNSCVTDVSLPNAALSELKIHDSTILTVDLSDQPFLDEVDFTGCTKVTSVTVSNCNKIVSLDLKNLSNLQKVNIVGCSALTSIDLSNCTKLQSLSITGANSLTEVILSGCTNGDLTISLLNVANLTTLDLSNTTTRNVVSFTEGFVGLKNLNLKSSNINAFQFGTKPISSFNGEYLLDLSLFDFESLNINSNSAKYYKFKNSKSTPLNISSSTFNGCTNLTRVFGHFNITSGSVFSGLTSFSIHGGIDDTTVPAENAWFGPDTDTEEGATAWAEDTELSTNLTISSTSLTSCFYQTSCNLYDVYYILDKCDNVITLNSCFSNCSNVITNFENPLRRNTFAHCGNVTSASSLFYATKVGGPLYSVTHTGDTVTSYNGLLSPMKKLNSASGMFNTGQVKYIDDLFFYKYDADNVLPLTSINSIFRDSYAENAVRFVDNCDETLTSADSDRYVYARASVLLKYLPNLTSLSSLFNGTNTWINFDLETYTVDDTTVQYCPIIAYNKAITSINGVFHNITAKGSLNYIFGGHSVFDSSDLFPRRLSSILDFISVGSYPDGKVNCPIHNNMFRQIKSVLTSISYRSGYTSYTYMTFGGSGINKTFLQEEDELFPTEIFKSVTNLTNCPYFFYNLNSSISTSDLLLPGDMFINNKKLSNISHCFHNMSSNIRYRLTSKGFINCQLTNVSYAFSGESNNYQSKLGYIPYGLFYQEKDKTTTWTGWTEEDATALGIDETYGLNGEERIEPNKYTKTHKVLNRTITNMEYALAYFGAEQSLVSPYTRDTFVPADVNSIAAAGDAVIFNEAYNPVKYLFNPEYDPNEYLEDGETPNPNYNLLMVILNDSYDPYEYVWNTWYYDGIYGLAELIEQSPLYNDTTVTELDKTIPEVFRNADDLKTSNSYTLHPAEKLMGYICPPDLFRYCSDAAITLTRCLYATSTEHTTASWQRHAYGIYGRIPADLFKPLTKITILNGVFENCRNILPYTWESDEGVGNMFPATLFENNKTLSNVTRLFAGLYIPNGVIIPQTLFVNNTLLSNLSYLFYNCMFLESATGYQQVPDLLFTNNPLVSNLSWMFAANTSPSGTAVGGGIKKINSTLFNSSKHKLINNLTSFLQYQSNTTGSVPEFWEWLNISTANKTNVFLGVKKSNITNSDAITTAGWDTGMTD